MLGTIAQVGLGGAVGAMLRFAVNAAAQRILGVGFPLGTLGINVLGSALMGIGVALLLERSMAPRLAPMLLVGVLGGFTTFSSFSLDLVALVERGEPGRAALYGVLSVGLSLLALVGGLALGRGV
jgi:CrcB protein